MNNYQEYEDIVPSKNWLLVDEVIAKPFISRNGEFGAFAVQAI